MTSAATGKPFVLTRVLNAPRSLVWKAFTDPAHMKQWWGPKGFTVLVSNMDLRPGGFYHYGMQAPDGSAMWGKMRYLDIVAPEKIVLINSFSDEAGGITRHPMHASWPLEMKTVFSFEDLGGGKTRFTLNWTAHNATAEEQKTFDSNHDSMNKGWGGTLEQLEAYLAKSKA